MDSTDFVALPAPPATRFRRYTGVAACVTLGLVVSSGTWSSVSPSFSAPASLDKIAHGVNKASMRREASSVAAEIDDIHEKNNLASSNRWVHAAAHQQLLFLVAARTDEWAPIWVEWLFASLIWICVLAWIILGSHRAGIRGKILRWVPAFSMWIFGYPMFFLFVSIGPSVYDTVIYLLNFVFLIIVSQYGVMQQFLLGAFCGPAFLFPISLAAQKDIVKYDAAAYALGVGWTTGISNAMMKILENHGKISTHFRFSSQVVAWTLIMSGIPIVMLACGQEMESYELDMSQTIRYSAFQLSTYTFIYYGICFNFEDSPLRVGDRVHARWLSGSCYYAATIAGINDDARTVSVDWADGDTNHRVVSRENVVQIIQ